MISPSGNVIFTFGHKKADLIGMNELLAEIPLGRTNLEVYLYVKNGLAASEFPA